MLSEFIFILISQLEVFRMELQGSSCDKVDIDLEKLLGLDDKNDLELFKGLENSLTPQKWNEIEKYLTEHLTAEQIPRAMIMLGPLHQDATEMDKLNANVSTKYFSLI